MWFFRERESRGNRENIIEQMAFELERMGLLSVEIRFLHGLVRKELMDPRTGDCGVAR